MRKPDITQDLVHKQLSNNNQTVLMIHNPFTKHDEVEEGKATVSGYTLEDRRITVVRWMKQVYIVVVPGMVYSWASLNSSASHFPQTPPPFCDWLYSDRLHTIDR
ncbi:conserved hypothetical protein [Trichinella spiralis]|uniref:hypothetical protein n=1 Tax=Trichinella spiralis TaxID=6334 RepID=UPI0001EFD9FC|nr:conserved hypothetical protein [Trichinella spiralis]